MSQPLVSIIIITSPSICHPSTILLDCVINSLPYIEGLNESPIHIILDGYTLRENEYRLKKGIINPQLAAQYQLFHDALLTKYGALGHHIHRLPTHHGYAMAVKYGLEQCTTPYAFILQHDRVFVRPFSYLPALLDCFETTPHLRYIGFPTSMSSGHHKIITNYPGLRPLNNYCIPINVHHKLQPLIFWYDSQHLVHVARYLEIYTPYAYLPDNLRALLTKEFINTMRLRPGDFIEDRFGQAQRNSLAGVKGDFDVVLRLFQWFGSYLLWDTEATLSHVRHQKTTEYVVHLRGRQDVEKISSTASKVPSMLETVVVVSGGEVEADEFARESQLLHP